MSWGTYLYEFQWLPFGISSAPGVFTKLLKPVVILLRRQGVRFFLFLDDLLVTQQTKVDLKKTTGHVLTLLQVIGFKTNWKKSSLTLKQTIQYLGLRINSTQMPLTV